MSMSNELPVPFKAVRASIKNDTGMSLKGRKTFDFGLIGGVMLYSGDKVRLKTIAGTDEGLLINITQQQGGKGKILTDYVIAAKDGVPAIITQGIVTAPPQIIARGRRGKKGYSI